MIILGIDPGIAIVGYGVIDYTGNKFTVIDYCAITTPAGMKVEDRLNEIYNSLNVIMDKYKPEFMAIEELFYNKNAKTVINVAEARGVTLLSAARKNIPIYEYTPLQVKQAVVGYGRAEKKQVQQMTKVLLNLEKVPKPDDTADALAIAICHAHSYNALSRIKY
jgi:crossover junction endodeoxyribonuclease RuvC